jgi:alpha-mannosidase
MQGRARIAGEEIALEVTRRWALRSLPAVNAQQIVVLNPDKEAFQGYVEAEPPLDLDLWSGRWLSELDGRPIPFQLVQAESPQLIHRIVFPRAISAGGYAHALVQDAPAPPVAPATDLEATPSRLANGCLALDLDGEGITQLTVAGRRLLGARGIKVHLRHDASDTWNLSTDGFREPVEEVWRTDGWTVEEAGPLRARVRAEGWIGHSRLRWTLTLHRADPRLYLQIEVNFAERFRLLQMPIHLAEAPDGHVDGLAGGHIERTSGDMEWPMQGWSRVQTSGGQLALVTNDAYSLSLEEAAWQWTLLRSPKMAWMGDEWGQKATSVYVGRDWHSDEGPHSFSFVLLTGENIPEASLDTVARQQAQPPVVFDRYDGIRRPPWGNNLPRHLGGS